MKKEKWKELLERNRNILKIWKNSDFQIALSLKRIPGFIEIIDYFLKFLDKLEQFMLFG